MARILSWYLCFYLQTRGVLSRLLNVGRYSFHIRVTIKTRIKSLMHEKNEVLRIINFQNKYKKHRMVLIRGPNFPQLWYVCSSWPHEIYTNRKRFNFKKYKFFSRNIGIPKQMKNNCDELDRGICMEYFIEVWLIENN